MPDSSSWAHPANLAAADFERARIELAEARRFEARGDTAMAANCREFADHLLDEAVRENRRA
jgi:hypothetical protein